MTVESCVVAAVVDEAIVLDLPAEPPGTGVRTIDHSNMGPKHLAERFFVEPEIVRLFGIQDFDHELRVVGGSREQLSRGGVARDGRTGRLAFRKWIPVSVMAGGIMAFEPVVQRISAGGHPERHQEILLHEFIDIRGAYFEPGFEFGAIVAVCFALRCVMTDCK